jgi:predicted nucleic acid-binding protein
VKSFPRLAQGWTARSTCNHQHADKGWTLTDCVSFVIMRERNVTDALTGDKHFEQTGFAALLK